MKYMKAIVMEYMRTPSTPQNPLLCLLCVHIATPRSTLKVVLEARNNIKHASFSCFFCFLCRFWCVGVICMMQKCVPMNFVRSLLFASHDKHKA
jgi:hypothetical protein